MPRVKRRVFFGLSSGAALAWPFALRAQKMPARIGLLFAGSADSRLARSRLATIDEGLRANGMVEGRDYVLEARFANGRYERFPDLAGELAQAGARIILVHTIAAVRAAQRLVPPLPVVMMAINDPVGTGLIASLARPGGHTTGQATLNEDTTPKMLDFLRTIVPEAKVVGVLFNPGNPSNPAMVDNIRALIGKTGITVQAAAVRFPEDLDPALASLAATRPGALLLLPDAANLDLADRIAAFAIEHRLPFLISWPEVVDFGGLLGYGASERKLLIRTGYYVKRILDGANPADLPVEQPTEIELRLNLQTARAIGLTLPPSLLARADETIE